MVGVAAGGGSQPDEGRGKEEAEEEEREKCVWEKKDAPKRPIRDLARRGEDTIL